MNITEMIKWRSALARMKAFGNTFGYRSNERNPYELVCEALESLDIAIDKEISGRTWWDRCTQLGFKYDGRQLKCTQSQAVQLLGEILKANIVIIPEKETELEVGGVYRWKYFPKPLIYKGHVGIDVCYHVFVLEEDPGTVWCKFKTIDFDYIERVDK